MWLSEPGNILKVVESQISADFIIDFIILYKNIFVNLSLFEKIDWT